MVRKNTPAAETTETWSLDKRLPSNKLVKAEHFAQTSGRRVETVKIQQIAALLWFPDGASQADRDAQIVQAIDLFRAVSTRTDSAGIPFAAAL